MYPLVRELAATGAPIRVPVAVACRVLGLSRQAYYAWLRDPIGERELQDTFLTNQAHDGDPEFGYRLLADDLRSAGHEVSDNRVWRALRGSYH